MKLWQFEQYANGTKKQGYWKNAGSLGVSQILLYLFLFHPKKKRKALDIFNGFKDSPRHAVKAYSAQCYMHKPSGTLKTMPRT